MTTFADGENGLSVRTKINDVLQHMDGTAGTLVVNEAGADVDFRVESDTLANALFVDGATGNVSLGTSAPGSKLDIYGAAPSAGLNTQIINSTDTGGDNTRYAGLNFVIGSDSSTASIRAFRTNSATDYSNALTFWTKGAGAGATTPTERMRITETGSVGIGTTSPGFYSGRLTVAGGNLAIAEGYEAIFWNAAGTGRASIQGVGTHEMAFFTNVSERMRITSAGSVVVGGTTAVLASANRGNVTVSGSSSSIISVGTSTAAYSYFYHDATGAEIWNNQSTYLRFGTSNQERMRIDNIGNVGIGATSVTAIYGRTLQIGDGSQNATLSLIGSGTSAYLATSPFGGLNLIGRVGTGLTLGTNDLERIRIDTTGRVLVGTTTASGANLLQVNSDALVNGMTVGRGAAGVATNTALGVSALLANTTGTNNTAGGYTALSANTIGTNNTAFGGSALGTNTTANNNTAFGHQALALNVVGFSNTAVGQNALVFNTASNNTAVGMQALLSNTTGTTNTSMGTVSLQANTTGSSNTALGYAALFANTTASNSTGLGFQALQLNTTGVNNTAGGATSMNANTTGNNNTAFGTSSLLANTTGGNNTVIGQGAGSALTTGDNNTIIGRVAGTAGLANTVIIAAGATERLRIDANGNMGLSAAPSAWASYRAIQNYDSSFAAISNSQLTLTQNCVYDGAWKYINSNFASRYDHYQGGHYWVTAPSGTAGNAITFTTAMTLTQGGDLGIGLTTPGYKLDVTSGAGTSIARFAGPANGLIDVTDGTGTFRVQLLSNVPFVGTFSNHSLVLTTNNTERLRIDSVGNVGIGTNAPNAAAILDVQSTTKGVRFPNMTTTQKNAIANVAGNVIFDTTLGKLCVNTGSGWQTITST